MGRADYEEDTPAGSRLDDVTPATTITGVRVAGERVRECLEHPVRMKQERSKRNPHWKGHQAFCTIRLSSARNHAAAADDDPHDGDRRERNSGALIEAHEKRARLQRELSALDGLNRLATFDVRRIERELRKRLTEGADFYPDRRRGRGRCSRDCWTGQSPGRLATALPECSVAVSPATIGQMQTVSRWIRVWIAAHARGPSTRVPAGRHG
jgi:hypothetical protein